MGKKCAIDGCKSGTSEDNNKTKRQNIRKTSVFQVPKNIQTRQLWSTAMGRQFSDGDCVCEWHFHASDIKREDIITLANGVTFTSPLEKRRLKPYAVPTLTPENQQNVDYQGSDLETALEEEIQEQENTAISFPDVKQEMDYGSTEDEDMPLSDDDVSYRKLATSSKKTISKQYENSFYLDEKQTNADTGFSYHILEASDDEVLDKDMKVEYLRPHFTLEQLRDHLEETCLPKSWSWAENPADDSLLLQQFDPATRQSKIIIEVHHDLSTTLCTNDNEVRIDIDRPVISIKRFNKILQKATKVIACSGTEFEDESRSLHCEGFIKPDAEFLKRQRMPRCRACCQRRKELQTRDYRRVKRANMLDLEDLNYDEKWINSNGQRKRAKM